MMRGIALPGLIIFLIVAASSGSAQTPPQGGETQTAINGINSYPGPGLVRYSPNPDLNPRRIDLFLSDWQGSMTRFEHGSLLLRDILIRGDNYAPPEKGAVLQYANFLAYGRLPPHAFTLASRLHGEQEVYYILGGEGEITAGVETAKLRRDNEPTSEEFRPRTSMAVKNEAEAHVRTPAGSDPFIVGGASGHWAHTVRELFSPADGLATEQSVITVTINPLTLGEPHPHRAGQEEVWAALEGNSLAFLGTELRIQRPRMAYMLPPDETTIHSNINVSDKPVKFLYFAKFPQGDNYTHATVLAHH